MQVPIFLLICVSHFIWFCNCEITQYDKKFLYFAYGSNLFEGRLRINVPSAVFITPAKLPGYRLDFDKYSPTWRGAPATIVETDDSESHVWGAVWAIDYREIAFLDKQEGVYDGMYSPKYVKVLTPEDYEITARVYEMESYLLEVRPEDLPIERRPSNTYLQVMSLGAYLSGVPAYYINYIRRFPTNGRPATENLCQELGYPFNANIQIS